MFVQASDEFEANRLKKVAGFKLSVINLAKLSS